MEKKLSFSWQVSSRIIKGVFSSYSCRILLSGLWMTRLSGASLRICSRNSCIEEDSVFISASQVGLGYSRAGMFWIPLLKPNVFLFILRSYIRKTGDGEQRVHVFYYTTVYTNTGKKGMAQRKRRSSDAENKL